MRLPRSPDKGFRGASKGKLTKSSECGTQPCAMAKIGSRGRKGRSDVLRKKELITSQEIQFRS